MAKYKAIQKKSEVAEQKHHVAQNNYKAPSKQFHGGRRGNLHANETPFQPPIKAHQDMLLNTGSVEEMNDVVLSLQQSYGNRYVQRLMLSMGAQAKLTVNSPNDKYEQEADKIADTVTHNLSSQVQQQPVEEEELLQGKLLQKQPEEEELLQGKLLQKQPEEEEELQTKPEMQVADNEAATQVNTEMEGMINKARGSGESLPQTILNPMERSFGVDLSGVKVHTDSESRGLSESLQARAFTTGQDIFFGTGQYQPQTQEGQKLIAHELTHTIQQSGKNRKIQRWGSLHGGTPHSAVTNQALDELGPNLEYINWDVRKYLVEHSDDMDARGGFLFGSYLPGKAYEKWGKIVQGARTVGKAVGGFGRKLGLMTRRGIGFLGEKLGITEEKKEEAEFEEELGKIGAPEKGWLGKGWESIKGGVKKGWRGLRRGIGFVGEKLGLSGEEYEEGKSKESERLEEEEEEIADKAAEEYDENKFYWRSETEAPNHGEGGLYSGDGTTKDEARVDEYVDNAVKAWKGGDRTQALQNLAFGLHSAEDRGSHGDGKPGTGHDPRLSNPPPPGAYNEFYNDYVEEHGKPDTGYDCDNKSKNPDGFDDAVFYAKETVNSFVKGVMSKEEESEKEEEKLRSYKEPGWLKQGARKVASFFGKDIVRKK